MSPPNAATADIRLLSGYEVVLAADRRDETGIAIAAAVGSVAGAALQVLVRHDFKPPAMTVAKAAVVPGGPMSWLKSVASTQCGAWMEQSGAKSWHGRGPKADAVALA